jgi:uncharacterized protein YabN with tetrapyrrole methylase and pyrophosphatase domain
VADAVRRHDDGALPGEVGDLLLNLAFQVVLAEERRAFGVPEVVSELERKMIGRHPHVFGDADEAPDWESMKAGERRGRESRPHDARDPLAGVPAGLEPLSRALRVQERAAGVGFDWPDVSGAIEKLREEIDELGSLVSGRAASPSSAGLPPSAGVVDEAGDLLFAAVNVCRLAIHRRHSPPEPTSSPGDSARSPSVPWLTGSRCRPPISKRSTESGTR